jgi:hypothetical protein
MNQDTEIWKEEMSDVENLETTVIIVLVILETQ